MYSEHILYIISVPRVVKETIDPLYRNNFTTFYQFRNLHCHVFFLIMLCIWPNVGNAIFFKKNFIELIGVTLVNKMT